MDALFEIFAVSHLFIGGGLGYVHELPDLPPRYMYEYDQNHIANPLGIASIGYEWEHATRLGEFTTRLEVWRHQSFIGVDDLGQDSAQVFVTWRPFKRR